MADSELLRERVTAEELDAPLAAMLGILAEHDVPVVFAVADQVAAEPLRRALAAPAGGVVTADSLESVLRLAGAPFGALPDAARDLGVVVVHDGVRVVGAHYMRPVERDAAGHLQRRPPATLGAWNERSGRFDHFGWAIHDELATRAGMTLDEFEDERSRRVAQMAVGARA
jgi:hypothetical protein